MGPAGPVAAAIPAASAGGEPLVTATPPPVGSFQGLSPYEMVAALQPLLETCGVERRLLGAFERRFPGLAPAHQRYLHSALPRAVEFEGREAAEALMRDALQGGT